MLVEVLSAVVGAFRRAAPSPSVQSFVEQIVEQIRQLRYVLGTIR